MKPERPQGSLRLAAETQTVEDLVALVARGGVRVPVFQRGLKWKEEDVVALFDSIGAARADLAELARSHCRESPVLLFHAISSRAAAVLLDGDTEAFLQDRKVGIEDAVNLLGERLAAWSRSDRPSIRYLLEQEEIQA